MCKVRLDAWIGTVINCVRENESVGWHLQKLYADMYVRLLELKM